MRKHLQLSRLDNGWLLGVVDLAGTGASGLKSLDNVHGLLVSNLAEDDMLAIQPGGDNGGNEELGAVAKFRVSELISELMGGKAYVFGPALAMERSPGLVCFLEKFSSANLSP